MARLSKRLRMSWWQTPFWLSMLHFFAGWSEARVVNREDSLIGWSERSVPPAKRPQLDSEHEHLPSGEGIVIPRKKGLEVLSWNPRIFLYRGLLTDDECDHLIKKSSPLLARSGVVADDGGDDVSDIRTSDGTFLEREQDPTIAALERKLSEWTMIPVGNGEGLQVLRYRKGQEYQPHFDYFFHEGGIDNGGNRLATVLMYLTDVASGGETVFPNVPAPPSQTLEAGYSECAMQGLAYKPQRGDAIAFWSLRTDGTLDKGSLHGSCPIISGEKYAATKWFHVAHYAVGGGEAVTVRHVVHRPPPPPAPPGCRDLHPDCPGWAEGGECDHNPGYMVGDDDEPGSCLLSCGRCDLMPRSRVFRR